MKTLNTIYLWLMLAACVLALAGCVEEKVSGTGEGGNISVKMNVNARGGSDIQAEMENAVKLTVPMTVDVNIGKTWYDTH